MILFKQFLVERTFHMNINIFILKSYFQYYPPPPYVITLRSVEGNQQKTEKEETRGDTHIQ